MVEKNNCADRSKLAELDKWIEFSSKNSDDAINKGSMRVFDDRMCDNAECIFLSFSSEAKSNNSFDIHCTVTQCNNLSGIFSRKQQGQQALVLSITRQLRFLFVVSQRPGYITILFHSLSAVAFSLYKLSHAIHLMLFSTLIHIKVLNKG